MVVFLRPQNLHNSEFNKNYRESFCIFDSFILAFLCGLFDHFLDSADVVVVGLFYVCVKNKADNFKNRWKWPVIEQSPLDHCC